MALTSPSTIAGQSASILAGILSLSYWCKKIVFELSFSVLTDGMENMRVMEPRGFKINSE